jgi:hypothetical protein
LAYKHNAFAPVRSLKNTALDKPYKVLGF